MDIYHIWCDLKPGQGDVEFAVNVGRYLGKLKADGHIAGFRLTRRKLGLGLAGLGEFHIAIETQDLDQLERAFQAVSSRADPVESLHQAVNSRVENFRAALYRDFPDPHRRTGDEKF
ncbi:MAG: hypothetical protein J2P50_03600 [Hyphomicrobiaceae bacterium]|nr:hypothetical protein [Hyphomicrobiaceae bacterium]